MRMICTARPLSVLSGYWGIFQQRYQMRNRNLSKAVPALEFCSFCNSQKCVPLVRLGKPLGGAVSILAFNRPWYVHSDLSCADNTYIAMSERPLRVAHVEERL